MEDEKRRVLDDEKRRVLDDEKTRGLTIQEMWTDVSDRFEAETGMSLRLKPAKTLRDCIDAVEKRQLPPAASESKAAVSGAEKAKSFGLGRPALPEAARGSGCSGSGYGTSACPAWCTWWMP